MANSYAIDDLQVTQQDRIGALSNSKSARIGDLNFARPASRFSRFKNTVSGIFAKTWENKDSIAIGVGTSLAVKTILLSSGVLAGSPAIGGAILAAGAASLTSNSAKFLYAYYKAKKNNDLSFDFKKSLKKHLLVGTMFGAGFGALAQVPALIDIIRPLPVTQEALSWAGDQYNAFAKAFPQTSAYAEAAAGAFASASRSIFSAAKDSLALVGEKFIQGGAKVAFAVMDNNSAGKTGVLGSLKSLVGITAQASPVAPVPASVIAPLDAETITAVAADAPELERFAIDPVPHTPIPGTRAEPLQANRFVPSETTAAIANALSAADPQAPALDVAPTSAVAELSSPVQPTAAPALPYLKTQLADHIGTKKLPKATQFIIAQAEAGVPQAQKDLALMLKDGAKGIRPNLELSARLYVEAAAAGNAQAAADLAYLQRVSETNSLAGRFKTALAAVRGAATADVSAAPVSPAPDFSNPPPAPAADPIASLSLDTTIETPAEVVVKHPEALALVAEPAPIPAVDEAAAPLAPQQTKHLYPYDAPIVENATLAQSPAIPEGKVIYDKRTVKAIAGTTDTSATAKTVRADRVAPPVAAVSLPALKDPVPGPHMEKATSFILASMPHPLPPRRPEGLFQSAAAIPTPTADFAKLSAPASAKDMPLMKGEVRIEDSSCKRRAPLTLGNAKACTVKTVWEANCAVARQTCPVNPVEKPASILGEISRQMSPLNGAQPWRPGAPGLANPNRG